MRAPPARGQWERRCNQAPTRWPRRCRRRTRRATQPVSRAPRTGRTWDRFSTLEGATVSAVVRADIADGLVLRSGRGRTALVATVAASAMASLDATVVNLALPRIGRDFGAGISALQWVLTGYLLALASLILLGGALGD